MAEEQLDSVSQQTNIHFELLAKHTARLWKYNKMTDIVVQVEKQLFPAHKSVLTCYSPYFRKLLMEPEKSSIEKMKLKSVTADAFNILLEYMYTGDIEVSCQNLSDVYQASRKLEMDDVTEKCNMMLTMNSNNTKNLLYIYVTAKKLGLRQTWQRALKAMVRRFEEIVLDKDYLALDVQQVCEFLSPDVIGARSEVMVYLAALKWLDCNYLEREKYVKQVVENVRFPMMSLEEIVACHYPPILPGIIEHPFVRNLITDATCYVSAKLSGQAQQLSNYNYFHRQYLLHDIPMDLWNASSSVWKSPNNKNDAAKKIQACYRSYRMRKQIRELIRKKNEAATKIQACYHGYKVRRKLKTGYRSKDVTKTEDSSNKIDILTTDPCLQFILNNDNSKCDWFDYAAKLLPKVDGPLQLNNSHVILAIGGVSPMKMEQITNASIILRYHPVEDKWERCGKLPMPRHHLAAVCLKESFYCLGGCDLRRTLQGQMTPTSSCFQFNYKNKQWYPMRSMHHCRMFHGAAVLYDIIYVVGGKDDKAALLSSIECYSIETDTWFELKHPLCCPRMGMGVASHRGVLWVVGGIIQPSAEQKVYIAKDVECFDPKTNRWLFNVTKLPNPVTSACLVKHENRLFVIGGSGKVDNSICSLKNVYYYEDEKDMWISTTSLPFPRHGVTSVSTDRYLFVVGGLSSFEGSTVKDVSRMDSLNKSWNICQEMPSPACGAALITLPPLK